MGPQIETALLEISFRLNRFRQMAKWDAELRDLIRKASDIGAYEVMILLRDLRTSFKRQDHIACEAIQCRIDRQIEADLTYVMGLANASGQPDMGD